MCFSDEVASNKADPVLNIVDPDIRRRTLIARREMRGASAIYTFDVYLQGDRETVFFDV
jgi:protocatechuate 3,4-dioxygenase alpha subunit